MPALLALIIDCGSSALPLTLQCELNHNKNLLDHERPPLGEARELRATPCDPF